MVINRVLKKLFIVVLSVLTVSVWQAPSASCNQLRNIQHKQKVTHEKIKKLKLLEHLEKNKLYKNQQKLENASASLHNTKAQYSSLENQLANMERDLATSLAEFNQANARMKVRIRQVFKNQRTGMFELIFSAKDLNSLLDVVYFEKIILKKDYQHMMAVKIKSQKIAKMKQDIENRKIELAQSIQTINSQQKYIKNAIAQNQNMIHKYKTDRATYERAERELARQSASIQSMISRNQGSSTVKISSTGFMKPIGGRITSPFGWRTHPIFNSRTFHSGVDIAGPNLGSIRASNSGKVIYAGWYGGYGKVVILDHGTINGRAMTTLYAHMSTVKARQGQFVQKGEVVGYEGTTGYSTGPHCHFEVRINGKPNNPLNYI
ncbi:MAG: murein hydrolase activator EnvC family protein [Candidatus Gastranaerophilaceae bacterium]